MKVQTFLDEKRIWPRSTALTNAYHGNGAFSIDGKETGYFLIYTLYQKLSTERKMLFSRSQSELKRMQFAAEVDGSMQIC